MHCDYIHKNTPGLLKGLNFTIPIRVFKVLACIYIYGLLGSFQKEPEIGVACLIDMGMKSDDSLGWFFYEGKSSAGISITPPKFNIAIEK